MEELKTSTRVLLISAVIMIVILVTGPLGYKFDLVPLMPSLASLMVSLLGSMLLIAIGPIFTLIAVKNSLPRNRNLLLVSLALCLLPIIVMGPQILKARSVPPIHDITTDMVNPPAFEALIKHRVHAINGLEYGSEEMPAEELSELQKGAYPNVKPLEVGLSQSDALARAQTVLAEQGLEIIATNPESGLVEATATTLWFGFKDDVVVRVSETATGARIDIRSVSRVGVSDVGANAARIERFLTAF